MGPTSPAPLPSPPRGAVPPPLPPQPPPGRFRRDPRLAAIYDQELAPLWTRPFGRLLLSHVAPLGKATVLDVMCHTGDPGLELLRRLPEARLFAVDPSSAMLDVARQKAGALLSRRAFFRTEPVEPRLPFDEAFSDLVISNLGLHDAAHPGRLLRDMARVAKPGAQIVATLPLRGTFAEFYTLVEQEIGGSRARLLAHLQSWPDAATVRGWAAEAGLVDLEVVVEPFTLLFAGGTDLFFSPVIEYGPLTAWKGLMGEDLAEMQARFGALRDAIDAACDGGPREATGPVGPRRPFALTVRAACLLARRA
jgi:ubiquinone/menaquinone biosynthesis C-methylase UbiE